MFFHLIEILGIASLVVSLKLVVMGQKVKELKKELTRGEVVVELPRSLKEKITDEILERLKSLNGSANATEQRGQWTLIAL